MFNLLLISSTSDFFFKRWRDKVTNEEVLQRDGCQDLRAIISSIRHGWLRLVHRIPQSRPLQVNMYGHLIEGMKATDRPLLSYTDVCNCDIKLFKRDTYSWEKEALESKHKKRSWVAGSRNKGNRTTASGDYRIPKL